MEFSVRPHRLAVFAAALGVVATAAPTREARADDVSPTGKGIVGGGLLGAEVVTITESLVGVHSGWAYLLGGVLGAGGGAVGGYFVEQNVSNNGQVPMYMLAGGLALVIPAVVLTLDATRYRPEEGLTEDKAPTGPAAEPGVPGGSISGTTTPGAAPPPPAPAAPVPAPPPQSLFDVHEGSFRLGVPVPAVSPMFSSVEVRQYGLSRNDAELKMPVLHVSF